MIVVDASAWVTALVEPGRVGDEARRILTVDDDWAVPDHARLEVLRTLWKHERGGVLSHQGARVFVDTVLATSVRTAPLDSAMLAEAWELRPTVSLHDAPYVALARSCDVPLVTRDARLARAARALGVVAVVPGDDVP